VFFCKQLKILFPEAVGLEQPVAAGISHVKVLQRLAAKAALARAERFPELLVLLNRFFAISLIDASARHLGQKLREVQTTGFDVLGHRVSPHRGVGA